MHEYKKPQISTYVMTICKAFKLDYDHVKATLLVNHPELQDKKCCANCGASMAINVYQADILNAILLLKAAEQVHHNLTKGMSFTEANHIHVPTLPTTDAVRRRSSQLAALNYLHQPKGQKRTGYYVITTWGWQALRGEPVPKSVSVFRGEIVERSKETTTLGQMFKTHTEKVEQAVKARKKIDADYRADIGNYDLNTWQTIAGYADGRIL